MKHVGSVPELFLVGSPKAFVSKAPLAVFSCCGRSAQIFISSPITGPMCARAHTNTLFAERVVYVSTFLLNTLLFAICVWLKSASKHMRSRNTRGRLGCSSMLMSAVSRLFPTERKQLEEVPSSPGL